MLGGTDTKVGVHTILRDDPHRRFLIHIAGGHSLCTSAAGAVDKRFAL